MAVQRLRRAHVVDTCLEPSAAERQLGRARHQVTQTGLPGAPRSAHCRYKYEGEGIWMEDGHIPN